MEPEAPPRTQGLLVVYHSTTGGTLQMARAAVAGAAAAEPKGRVQLRHALDTGPADVLGAAGYIFATPENLAAVSGPMKDFFDRCYYPVLERIAGRPYATLVCAGSDGENAARQIQRIATGWRLQAVAPPLIVCTHAQSAAEILAPKLIGAADLAHCAELGATLAAGLALGIF